jgi:hypothetical protein
MQDQLEVRNERSKRQMVSPSEISVIDGHRHKGKGVPAFGYPHAAAIAPATDVARFRGYSDR